MEAFICGASILGAVLTYRLCRLLGKAVLEEDGKKAQRLLEREVKISTLEKDGQYNQKLVKRRIQKPRLKENEHIEQSDDLCPICLEVITPRKKTTITTVCQHIFHKKCIKEWTASHSRCPMCRQRLYKSCKKCFKRHYRNGVTI